MANRVLIEDYSPSSNFYTSDLILSNYLESHLSKGSREYCEQQFNKLGALAANEMNPLSLTADKNGPELVKRNAFGEDINEISFHPAYWDLMSIAVDSGMMRVKWEPELRKRFIKERHRLGFGIGFLYAMSEMGIYCPLCMTDGAARLVDLYCNEDDKARILPHIATSEPDEFYTGAMFLTEKAGGSDVGANLVKAKHFKDDYYHLNGEKWFCSNANADIIFVLARTDENIKGTKGLSLFLVEKKLPDGSKNPIEFIRLKDKLGVRSMASAECMLTNTVGKLIGKEQEGFKIMAEMMNLSRIYNSVAAVSVARRAMVEAYQFLCNRPSFGKLAIEHALIRTKLQEVSSLYNANFYMLWRTITALDNADNGDKTELALLRLLVPMIKKWSSESGVYIVRESMELMGGIGYIEDQVMPKLMRDVMVLPIWEGAGNIMILDMLRAITKSEGFVVMCSEIEAISLKSVEYGKYLSQELKEIKMLAEKLNSLEQDSMEVAARVLFERLTKLYSNALLVDNLNDKTTAWVKPSIDYIIQNSTGFQAPLSIGEIKAMIGWS
jgi:acyl-CoA dehydrogenase